MTVGRFGRAGNERNIQPVGSKLRESIACCALRDFDVEIGMVLSILTNQLCKEAARNQGIDTDA